MINFYKVNTTKKITLPQAIELDLIWCQYLDFCWGKKLPM